MNIKRLNVEFLKRRSSPSHKLADWMTNFVGSMLFVYIHVVIFTFWIVYNLVENEVNRFDPFPFGLLTLIVSLEAIFLSSFVLISQNKEAQRAELRSELDYEVNVKAGNEVEEINNQLDRIESKVNKLNKIYNEIYDNEK